MDAALSTARTPPLCARAPDPETARMPAHRPQTAAVRPASTAAPARPAAGGDRGGAGAGAPGPGTPADPGPGRTPAVGPGPAAVTPILVGTRGVPVKMEGCAPGRTGAALRGAAGRPIGAPAAPAAPGLGTPVIGVG